jgi:hypothetical protein
MLHALILVAAAYMFFGLCGLLNGGGDDVEGDLNWNDVVTEGLLEGGAAGLVCSCVLGAVAAAAYAFSWVETGSQALRIVFGLLLADIGVSFVAMLVLLCRKRAVSSRTSTRP